MWSTSRRASRKAVSAAHPSAAAAGPTGPCASHLERGHREDETCSAVQIGPWSVVTQNGCLLTKTESFTGVDGCFFFLIYPLCLIGKPQLPLPNRTLFSVKPIIGFSFFGSKKKRLILLLWVNLNLDKHPHSCLAWGGAHWLTAKQFQVFNVN